MYKLTRISAINWYLVRAKDIDIREATAFIGPTGSGKTSLEDAIQTVICAASHRHVHTNASASGKSDRKILDYCLGYIVPKNDGGEPVRSSCETVLALVFSEERRDGSRHDITVGLAMSARVEDSREQVLSRFIAPGYQFSVDHTMEEDEHGRVIKRWDDIEKGLKQACPAVRFYRHSAEKFVTDMLAEMRKHGRQPDTRHFLHAFSNAVAFKPIFDPTQFVRTYILEPDPLEVERVRDAIGRWRYLAEAVRQIEEKLKRLTTVRKRYDDWGAEVIDRAANRWGLACARTERARFELRRQGNALVDANVKLREQETIEQSLKRELERSEAELRRLESTLAEKGVSGKLQQIATELENAKLRLKEVEDVDRQVRQALQMAANLTQAHDFLPASTSPVIAAAQAALVLLAKPGLEWLTEHTAAITGHLDRFKVLAELPERLRPQIDDRVTELADLRKRRDLAEENAKRAAAGATPLSSHTDAYLRLLRDAGIEALVLCDVVEPVDKDWQFAAESLLGLFREAVIVDPRYLNQANEILFANRNRHGLHRIRLVKTSRTREVDIKLATDSLATVLKTDDPHAQALICSHLGGVKMVETVAELERANRAIMRDGRATAGLAFSVNQDLTPILGRQDGSAAASLHEEATRLKGEIARLVREKTLLEQASRAAENLASYKTDLDGASFRYDEIRRQMKDTERRKQAVLSEEDTVLVAEIEALKSEMGERKEDLDEVGKTVRAAIQVQARVEAAAKAARVSLREAVKSKRQTLKLDDETLQVALRWAAPEVKEVFRGFRGTTNPYLGWRVSFSAASAYEPAIKEHETALEKIDERITRLANNARSAFDQYLRDYGIERPMSDDQPYTFDYHWVILQHSKLQQNELREHREMAESAEREMYLTLKEDLLVNLNGRFQKLDAQLKTLNSQLRRHKFTGQFYKFGKKADSRYDRLRRLAMEVGTNPEQAQAIVEGRSGDLVLQAAMDELNEYLDNTGGEGMEDYRNYYTFDLYMRPATTEEDDSLEVDEQERKSKGLISLSARATVGSGGEGQAPFYVAIAASMALAYYPGGHPNGEPSGMGLVLFDEAFNKLDITTTQSLIRFFKDLGLQLILAAPEDKRPTFTEVLDCIVSVNKDLVNQTVYLDSEFPTPYAQEQIAGINPDHVGIEGFRARIAEITDA
ncbi:SbcC/MukB-like Walker B domain-containing protein [Telmatospirillum sp.]|uniref:SbcC/MukB-like Walker B domain-containing protein n=1 Tax=Telmatospirillum sp. TaxID=2079197 RepID=UPI002849332D|nr:SbcC/MukB-like Walker B domain-containing protein [Telmatospirillum sp.]MDR3439731.1 SbcC/MukB-like Walker B domain-containing protein [Telmatospirillum sp.]